VFAVSIPRHNFIFLLRRRRKISFLPAPPGFLFIAVPLLHAIIRLQRPFCRDQSVILWFSALYQVRQFRSPFQTEFKEPSCSDEVVSLHSPDCRLQETSYIHCHNSSADRCLSVNSLVRNVLLFADYLYSQQRAAVPRLASSLKPVAISILFPLRFFLEPYRKEPAYSFCDLFSFSLLRETTVLIY